MDCEYCHNYSLCEFHDRLLEFGIEERIYSRKYHEPQITEKKALIHDDSKCIRCRRCLGACRIFGSSVLELSGKGVTATITFNEQKKCVQCGMCIFACPTAAMTYRDDVNKAWHYMEREDTFTVAIVNDQTCIHLGPFFGEKDWQDDSGKIAAMLRKLHVQEVVMQKGIHDESDDKDSENIVKALRKKHEGKTEGRKVAVLLFTPSLAEKTKREMYF
jgi:NADH dehydrogenase/NADH:ubiquinone oxidoreductase subunit G